MVTKDKITEIFCMADDFCKLFDAITAKYTLKPTGKRKYHRSSTMSKAEVMLIMILFHDSGYRCFKHFYLEKICNEKEELLNFMITPGDIDDRKPLEYKAFIVFIYGKLYSVTRATSARTSFKGFSLTEYSLLPN